MTYALLGVAVVSGVTGTLCAKASDGFRRPRYHPARKDEADIAGERRPGTVDQRVLAGAAGAHHQEEGAERRARHSRNPPEKRPPCRR